MILNIAWALCSLGLIWFWLRAGVRVPQGTRPRGRTTQILALAMVVMLLLPVISLSDDLMSMQGPAETDSCLRRAQNADEAHPSVIPAALAMPEQLFTGLAVTRFSEGTLQTDSLATPATLLTRSLDSRPPPQA